MVVSNEVLKIGIVDIYPYGYAGKKGIHADWWKEIAKRANVKIKFFYAPLARVRQELRTNIVDLAIYGSLDNNDILEDDNVNIIEFGNLNFSIFSRLESANDIHLLKGKFVGGIRGASNFKELSKQIGFIPIEVNSYKIGADMYAKGRIEGFYGLESVFIAYYQANPSNRPLINAHLVASIPKKIRASKSFARKYPHLIKIIHTVSKTLKQENYINTSKNDHMNALFAKSN